MISPGCERTIDLVTRAADPFPTDSLVNGEIVNVAVVSGTDSNCGDGSTDPACSDDWPVRHDDSRLPPLPTRRPAISPFTGAAILWRL